MLSLLWQSRHKGDTPSELMGNCVFPVYLGETNLGGKDTETEEMADSLSLINSQAQQALTACLELLRDFC